MPLKQGTERIDCLNRLCEEYWWPPRVYPDSISTLANIANKEALSLNYTEGIATSIMLFGVAEIYRKNFLTAEKYLRQALNIFETTQSDFGLGWCNLWLGQTLYSQNNFPECLACLERSVPFLDKAGEWDGKGKAWAWMGGTYANLGNYDSSYFYCSASLLVRQHMNDHACVAYAFTNMGHLYEVAGSTEDALDYYRQGFHYAKTHGVDDYTSDWVYLESVGNFYRAMNSVDSSYYYLQRALQNDPANKLKQISFAETLLNKDYCDSALQIFLQPIQHFRKENDRWDLMRVLLDIGQVYERKKKYKAGLPYALESLSIAQQAGAKQYILSAYKLLSTLYKSVGENDRAYSYMEQYVELKDSIVNSQFRWKLANYKEKTAFNAQQEHISLLDKDNKILDRDNKIKEEKLRRASLLKWSLILGLLITILSGIFIYRNLNLKRKNDNLEHEKSQSELKLNASELEMQALRAQMNPHFIFNCLSSINRFILKNETEAASDYLTKFSRLIRIVLANSKSKLITLEDELEMLRLYLDMERLRFKNSFNYTINFVNSIDIDNIYIPSLLLQPFAENAIWHGLMNKESGGMLTITLTLDDDSLVCCITDNGIGRKAAAELRSKVTDKRRSMGLKITQERLALLNVDDRDKTFFEFEDLYDENGNAAGTTVILRIRIKDLAESHV